MVIFIYFCGVFFFSSRRRHTRCAVVTGVQTCALPIYGNALFTMLDVTDSRRIEQALRERNTALEEADQVKTAFVPNMSYELRTPLTSIAGFTEMLQAGYAGEQIVRASCRERVCQYV